MSAQQPQHPARGSGRTAGLVLAAGGGSRMGLAKALVEDESGSTWVERTVDALRRAGCTPVLVVVGAAGDEVRAVLARQGADDLETVEAADWATGMAASLRAGLTELARRPRVDAAVVAVVDTPGLTSAVVRRLLEYAGPSALARAMYNGRPGHPVILGAEHLTEVAASAHGDVGARDFLSRHPPVEVECADLADGADVDRPEDLPAGHRLG